MIESWLIWQTVKVSFWVFLGAFLLAFVVWKLLDWEANRNARRINSETDRRD